MSDIVSRARAALDGESAFTDPLDDLVRELCDEAEKWRCRSILDGRDRLVARRQRDEARDEVERLRNRLGDLADEPYLSDRLRDARRQRDDVQRALDGMRGAWWEAIASAEQKRDAISRAMKLADQWEREAETPTQYEVSASTTPTTSAEH